jgi:hypothetical protein
MKSSLPSAPVRITIKDNKVDGIQNYDSDNNYPGRILDIIKASGTATSCTNLYAKFLNGKGFNDKNFWKSRVNRKGVTVDKLLRATTGDYSKFKGYALHINYNALFQVNEVSYVPFDHCRLKISDDQGYVSKIAVYDDWECKREKKVNKDKIHFIDVYNPDPDVILSHIEKAGGIQKYKGQIFWRSSDLDSYPLSSIDAVIEDVLTDTGIKETRRYNVSKNFMAAHIFEYPKEFESDDERQIEKDNLKTFQGPEGTRIMMYENSTNQEKGLKITKLESNDTDKMFQVTNRTCKDSIIEIFTQPPILLGVQVAGKLGSAQEIKDAYIFYNSVTSDERRMFEEDYTEIFSRYRNLINSTKDYSITPLTLDEGTAEPALISVIGIGGTAAMTGILEGQLKDHQKINALEIIFGLSHEDSVKLVLGA